MMSAWIAAIVFISQLFARWEEGGWLRLISFSILFTSAHLILISRIGKRTPEQIKYIVRDRARIQGAMASIVEWQSLKMQEYRYHVRLRLGGLLSRFGMGFSPEAVPFAAGPYNPEHHLE